MRLTGLSVMMPSTRYAARGEYRIAYQVWGDGPVDLVIVWGTMSHLEVFWEDPLLARLLDRLGRSLRVINFDRLGTGLSDRPDRLPTLEARMDDIRAVIDTVGCGRVALMGESEGGATSILFAATYPDRVSHLVLYGATARLLWDDDYPAGSPPERLTAAFDYMVEHWGEPSTWAASSPDASPERLAWGARYMRMAGGPKTAADAFRAAVEIDVRSVLPVLSVPVLVLYKAGDRLISPDHGRYLATHIPGAVSRVLDGRSHYIADDDADSLADAAIEFLTGTPPDHDADRVLATVLFTDIVASTDTAVSLGDSRWRDLLDRHDRLVHDAVARFRGRLIKTTGDGALATFDGPARAVRAAEAIVAGVGSFGIEARAGVHTGELELRGNDVGGIAVHIGARIAGLAGPGQVLVSRTVVDLVVGSQLVFTDARSHTLKGVPGAWPLYALDRSPTSGT
jgi:class 3 adenylate cyclase